jgi:hypothetical protein
VLGLYGLPTSAAAGQSLRAGAVLLSWCQLAFAIGLGSCQQRPDNPLFPVAAIFTDYPNSQNFILHYADMVDSTSLTNLLK